MVMGRVFIVDDEAHVRKTVGLVLTQGGYEVLEAVDGEEAIAAIQSYPPGFSVHAIICDIDLPKVNGHDLIAFIRAKLPSVPVIVLTGYPDVQGATYSVQARCGGLSHQAGSGTNTVGCSQAGYRRTGVNVKCSLWEVWSMAYSPDEIR